MEKIKEWYDGYSWDGLNFLYNPYSVLRLFDAKKFKNFWFTTGTPTFLMEKLKESGRNINASINEQIDEETFDTYDIEDLNLNAIMFQTGYLTIKSIDHQDDNTYYTLNFPNKEVRESFIKFAVKHYANSSPEEIKPVISSLLDSLNNKDLDSFLVSSQSLFSSITTKQLDKVKNYEGFYHSIIFIMLKMLGVRVQCEVQSSFGATDAVVQTEKTIYVIEFKKDSAQIALDQIKTKKYYAPYLSDQREIIIAGFAFAPEQRNLTEVIFESIEK